MRVKKLELLRYGHLEDTELQFSTGKGNPDFHLVYGPNEAGKSTTRMALEDFLFGVPRRSTIGFKHGNANLQIGAQIETSQGDFVAIRRKGTSNTLRDRHTNEALADGEADLRRALNNNSLEFFNCMFSLDHERLREGARAILDANDDVGRALFSATAGLVGLQDVLEGWKGEANQLWAPTKSKSRKYYSARDRFEEAKKRVAELSTQAADWESCRTEVERLDDLLGQLSDQIQQMEPRRRKLARIRRVKGKVTQYYETALQLDQTKDCPRLREDAEEHLSKLLAKHNSVNDKLDLFAEEAKQLEADARATTYDERVISDASEIEELNELRAKMEQSERELVRRQQELNHKQASHRSLAQMLGWESDSFEVISQRVPSRQRNRVLKGLVEEQRMRLNAQKNAREQYLNAETRERELSEQVELAGSIIDLGELHAAIEYSQKESDEVANLPRLQLVLKSQIEQVEQIERSLFPSVDMHTLETLKTPPRTVIQATRDELRRLSEDQRLGNHKVLELDSRVAKAQADIDSYAKTKDFVTVEKLSDLRRVRDEHWFSLRERYFDSRSAGEFNKESPSDFSVQAANYEQEVSAADGAADKRFENAESEARYNEMQLNCERLRREKDSAEKSLQAIDSEIEDVSVRWRTEWSSAPFDVADPETMLVWDETCESLRSALTQRNDTEREVEQLAQRDSDAQARLHDVLRKLMNEPRQLDFASLAEAIAFARNYDGEIKERNAHSKGLREQQRAAMIDKEKQQKSLQGIERQEIEWKSRWQDALESTGLSTTENLEKVAEILVVFDDLRETANSIEELVEKSINPIQAELSDFRDRVERQISISYEELKEGTAFDKVRLLVEKLRFAQDRKSKLKNLNTRATDLKKKQEEAVLLRNEIVAEIDEFRGQANAEDINALRECIKKSDEHRALDKELNRLKEDLENDGDGFAIQELREECETVQDLDAARSEELELDKQLAHLREKQQVVLREHTTAQQRLDETAGADDAAQAELDRQFALADMKNAIEDFIPIRAAALVLDWAIDRFRKERQGPLVKRAGEIFETLTLGSFSQLETQMGSKGPTLVAYRAGGEAVELDGLSEGTVDQLYLALRIAAIEKHVADTDTSLPLVVDDLFTNFDDERAAAGVRVLHDLSRNCQVLFFTHHRHLVEIARDVVGKDISLCELPTGAREAPQAA
ncbi:MAG: AAA family ATPase [Gammaproteobacteria bacterium]|nr:AAA family ATPase [Gammaproteobacteria bacterium]